MKFKIIATLLMLVVLGLAYVIIENNESPAPTDAPSSDGIVLH